MWVMEQEVLAAMTETSQCLDTGFSPSASQAEPQHCSWHLSPACGQWWDTLPHLGGLIPVPCALLRKSSRDIQCQCCREKYKWRNPGKLVLPLRPVPAAGRRRWLRSSLGEGI